MFHDRSKHIEIRYHFIRDYVQREVVKMQYIPTDEQGTKILTTVLIKGKFLKFQENLGMV